MWKANAEEHRTPRSQPAATELNSLTVATRQDMEVKTDGLMELVKPFVDAAVSKAEEVCAKELDEKLSEHCWKSSSLNLLSDPYNIHLLH